MTKKSMILKTEDRETAFRKIKRLVINILLMASILLVIITAVFGTCTLFDYKPYLIISESMEPAYKKYALVLIQYNTYDDVKPGDVIAFKSDALNGKPALHRVVSTTLEGYITKGDANKLVDDQIIGLSGFLGREIWHTNLTAKLIPALKTPRGFIFLTIMPALLIILVTVFIKLCGKLVRPKDPRLSVRKEE